MHGLMMEIHSQKCVIVGTSQSELNKNLDGIAPRLQHVTVPNSVGNYNTIVSICVSKHR